MDSSITFPREMKEQQIAIIGAGISGLLACKHTLEKGFNPIVLEAGDCIGGVWSRTVESTKLQCPKDHFQFSDFPWPNSVSEMFPDYTQVLHYLQSYALHFNIFPQIKFNSKVISIDYLSFADEKMCCWSMWGGTGEAFSPKGKWNVTVEDVMHPMDPYKVYQVDFVILCVGLFSGLPNIPDIPISEGAAGNFNGPVLHSMDYAAMDKIQAAKLVEGKRVTVVGSRKSSLDIATQIAKTNGATHPCTLVFRRVYWPGTEMLVRFIFRFLTRFSELMIHKPDEGVVICFLALVLSPLRQIFSIVVEWYLKWTYPLKKYDMVPDHTFLSQIYSCMFTILPESFYDRVNEGSLVLKKSPTLCFCEKGFILDQNESDPLETDIVILGTGYKGDEKLSNIFSSIDFRKCIRGTQAPFYRQCIHPRIPQLAIVGYIESPATIFSFEMRSKWIAHFLDGKFRLPSIQKMEENVKKWEKNGRRYGGRNYRRECAGVLLPIHCNDEISMDIGTNPKRKKWFFPEFFSPYHPFDYAGL